MTEFMFDEPEFTASAPAPASASEQRRAHAAEVMADLAGVTLEKLAALPAELPVEAAVACGNCRLYAGVSAQMGFPAWLAVAAAGRLVELLDQATADANGLDALLENCPTFEQEDIIAGLLHARMDSWAAMLQLDDVLEYTSDDAARAELETAVDDFYAALDRFDRALFARQRQLGTLTATHLFTNLRHLLAPEWHDPLPWWLDGRLESDAIDQLAEQKIFMPVGGAAATSPLTVGHLRESIPQIYAAAAAGVETVDRSAALRCRWRSPDGKTRARLVPPATRQPVPERLVLDFVDAAGHPALHLLGTPCSLAGIETVVEKRHVDGQDRAAAMFPGAAFIGPASQLDSRLPLELIAGRPGTAWPVDSMS